MLTSAVEDSLLVGFGLRDQRFAVEMVSCFAFLGAWPALVHVCTSVSQVRSKGVGILTSQLLLHLGSWQHVNVLESQWLHDVLLDQVVQAGLCGSLHDDSGPVNVDTVLPLLTGLVDKRHTKDVSDVSAEDERALAEIPANFEERRLRVCLDML